MTEPSTVAGVEDAAWTERRLATETADGPAGVPGRRRPLQLPSDDPAHAGIERTYVAVPSPSGGYLVVTLLVPRSRPVDAGVESVRDLVAELAQLLRHLDGQLQLRRLSQALEQGVEGTFLLDLDGVVRYVNASFCRLTHLDEAVVVGRRVNDLFRPPPNDEDPTPALPDWPGLVAAGLWSGEVVVALPHHSATELHATLSTIRGVHGDVERYLGSIVDISERKRAEAQIHRLAYFDALTGLANRRYLAHRVQQAVASFHRSGHHSAVLFIDLDGFKHVNDSLGHDNGDALLQQTAQRLLGCVREEDTVARIGGDEFVVLLHEAGDTATAAAVTAETVVHRILTAVSEPVPVGDHVLATTPSIGVAVIDEQASSSEEVLRQADLAMYDAKAAGRNTARYFNPGLQVEADSRASLEVSLRRAVAEGELALHFQPQVDAGRRAVSLEALLRWHRPSHGIVPPTTFIGLAEQNGQIHQIGSWVLDQACRVLAGWAGSPATEGLTLAVNVSARQFRSRDFVPDLARVLAETGAPGDRLELELTETSLLDDVAEASATMSRLRDLGVSLSLDDFGTGYSSLAYLQRLPLSKLKIDQQFVAGLPSNTADAVITRTIIAMVHSLGLSVVAEGVEDEQQQAFLAENGCDYFQGYLHGRPVALPELDLRDTPTR